MGPEEFIGYEGEGRVSERDLTFVERFGAMAEFSNPDFPEDASHFMRWLVRVCV
ncbi:MAG: hypothetical protein ACJAYU_002047 [Bradymonadia bacterium]|jgi:hypothetical protein